MGLFSKIRDKAHDFRDKTSLGAMAWNAMKKSVDGSGKEYTPTASTVMNYPVMNSRYASGYTPGAQAMLPYGITAPTTNGQPIAASGMLSNSPYNKLNAAQFQQIMAQMRANNPNYQMLQNYNPAAQPANQSTMLSRFRPIIR